MENIPQYIENIITKFRNLEEFNIKNFSFRIGKDCNSKKVTLGTFECEWDIEGKYSQATISNYRCYKTEVKIPYSICCQRVRPDNLNLIINVDGIAEIFINDKKIKEFENNATVKLPGNISPGDTVKILVSIYNEYRNPSLLSAKLELLDYNENESKFIQDVSISLHTAFKLLYWDTFQKSLLLHKDLKVDKCKYNKEEVKYLRKMFLNNICKLRLDSFEKADKKEFFRSAKEMLNCMTQIAKFSKRYTLSLACNSHIDMAWLWRWKETREISKGTFENVLKMMKKFPDLVFTQSQAQAYRWVEEDEPGFLRKIKQKVKEGKWEVIGGMWVEPDCNLIDGESWVRQILYGKQYFMEHFKEDIKIGWNVDSFGYNLNMPQFYNRSGIKYFITQKVGWNEKTVFPYHIFWWESPDKSRVLTYFPYRGYCLKIDPYFFMELLKMFEVNTGLKNMLVLWGIGDHGGSPTPEMLNKAERLKEFTIYPEVKFSRVDEYMENLNKLMDINKLPVWKDELYVEVHQGTYTVHGKIKYQNRKSEVLLTKVEEFSTLAGLYGFTYPEKELGYCWKKVLFNQFHDILPGSSIQAVYQDTDEDYLEVKNILESKKELALSVISFNINTSKLSSGRSFVVYNSLSWNRNGIVSLEVPSDEDNYMVLNKDGKTILSQINKRELIFSVKDIPSIGYTAFQLCHGKKTNQNYQTDLKAGKYWLENEYLRLEISEKTGNIKRIYDKENKREVLDKEANQLQLLEDKPTWCNTWNVNFTGKVFYLDRADSIEILESGPLRAIIRIKKSFKGESKHKYYGTGFKETPGSEYPSSFFVQDIILYNDERCVIIKSEIDWWEDRIMLKAGFPVNVKSDNATYEIPYGYIERSNNPQTEYEKAKIEVPMLKWMDISEQNYGVSLINDCKYGGDVKGNIMRLSLLRSPLLAPHSHSSTPYPSVDRGKHKFFYCFYPHKGTFKEAGTVKKAYEFNYPLDISFTTCHAGKLDTSCSFIKIKPDNVIIPVIKQAEKTDNLILRCYETHGVDTTAIIEFYKDIKKAVKTNLLEEHEENLKVDRNKIIIKLKKFEIATLEIAGMSI